MMILSMLAPGLRPSRTAPGGGGGVLVSDSEGTAVSGTVASFLFFLDERRFRVHDLNGPALAMMLRITDYDAFVTWFFSTLRVDDVRAWDALGDYFKLISRNGLLLDMGRMVYVPWNVLYHSHFSDFGVGVARGIEREELLAAVTRFVWRSEGATERVLAVVARLGANRGAERGPLWTRTLGLFERNIRCETPEYIFRVLCDPRVPPEYKNAVTVWKIHLFGLYAGRYDELVLMLKAFAKAQIQLSDEDLLLINRVRHYNSIQPAKRTLKEKTFTNDAFFRTSETEVIGRHLLTTVLYGGSVYLESVVDRVAWGAVLWWLGRESPRMVAPSSVWQRYCRWMGSPGAELPDE
uniref:ORF33 n=1 Tax=Latid herpesvirus 1 TaxID=3096545 RepID=A0AB33V6K7_9VIRU